MGINMKYHSNLGIERAEDGGEGGFVGVRSHYFGIFAHYHVFVFSSMSLPVKICKVRINGKITFLQFLRALIYLSIYLAIYLAIDLSIYLPVNQSVHLSICLFICLSVYRSIAIQSPHLNFCVCM